jgi:hypothetical protein
VSRLRLAIRWFDADLELVSEPTAVSASDPSNLGVNATRLTVVITLNIISEKKWHTGTNMLKKIQEYEQTRGGVLTERSFFLSYCA